MACAYRCAHVLHSSVLNRFGSFLFTTGGELGMSTASILGVDRTLTAPNGENVEGKPFCGDDAATYDMLKGEGSARTIAQLSPKNVPVDVSTPGRPALPGFFQFNRQTGCTICLGVGSFHDLTPGTNRCGG